MGTSGSQMGTSGAQGPQANMNQGGQQASQQDIQQAQQQLKSQGLYRGAVDGVMGPETQTALMAFQRQHSLPQSAQLDQQTLDALNGGGSNSGAGMTGSTPTGAQQPGGAQGMTNSPAGTTNPASNSGGYNR
jgi:peptidoglycan hydrolase-like protein with peptidoglycan-binding domain